MSNLCPYPGLRPFNEEESIFFKGREQQVERIVKRLEEKKFLMVNGASGDGKSSLIFAGVIPYAKAGFFKAKYNNWLVADFRPERAPLKNIAASVCRQLKIENVSDTEKKLGYGFSALCDLYKSSPYYIDEKSSEWLQADEAQKKAIKRKGANLLILVDQFEEFFTNPENYQKGVPSTESQKTINLLLETYKLATAQDLPIYVVCTMRSDYIGQCASFRGLAEAIGYSQFFVPRLKRQEIEQVIEGPAELAGGKISKRLTQTLINNLTEGFDQLPILQHALNHVWKMAENGVVELDLIHLAQVGGVSPKVLTIEDREKFNQWFGKLPEYKQQLLQNPSLSNVLNAHANELYLTAHLHYYEKFGEEISIERSQKIIKGVFTCLTKMDTGRAVRNRMTLEEISQIIQNEYSDTRTIDKLLSIYREQGNTFIQPFLEEGQNYQPLSPNQVLDITHESLIRNWTQLNEWAKEEYEHLQNYLDFSKQLERWVNNNYSNGFLLPIGPLTYFEAWIEKLNPNKYWILRYEKFKSHKKEELELAEFELSKMKRFLSKSSKKQFFTKTLMKYGANKVAAFVGIVSLVISIAYFYNDYRSKQNDVVLKKILTEGEELLTKSNVQSSTKAKFIILQERLYPGIEEKLFKKINSDTSRFEVAKSAFLQFASVDMLVKNELESKQKKYQASIHYAEVGMKSIHHLLQDEKFSQKDYFPNKNEFEACLKALRLGRVIQDNYPNKKIKDLETLIMEHLEKQLEKFFLRPDKIDLISHKLFNEALSWQLSLSKNKKEAALRLVERTNCLEKDQSQFRKIYPGSPIIAGYMGNEKIRDQGGYYLLAKAFAVLGEKIKFLNCLDSLVSKNEGITLYSNYQPNNLILDWLLLNPSGYQDFKEVVQYSCKLCKTTSNKMIFENLDIVLFPEKPSAGSITSNAQDQFLYRSSQYNDLAIQSIAKLSRWQALQNNNSDSVHFRLAEYYKKMGFFFGIRKSGDEKPYFDSLMVETTKISSTFLNNKFTTEGNFSSTTITALEYLLMPFFTEQTNYFWSYQNRKQETQESTLLFKYLVQNWKSISAQHSINLKIFDYYLAYLNNLKNWWYGNVNTGPELLRFLVDYKSSCSSIGVFAFTDTNYFNVLMGHYYFKNSDFEKAKIHFETFKNPKVFEKIHSLERWVYQAECMNTYRTEIAKYFAIKGDTNTFEKHLAIFRSDAEKKNVLVKSIYLLLENHKEINSFYFLRKLHKLIGGGSSIPNKVLMTNTLIGGAHLQRWNHELLKSVSDDLKANAIKNLIAGYAKKEQYFKAYSEIPSFTSNTSRLWYINTILWNRCTSMSEKDRQWKEFDFLLYPEIGKDYLNSGDFYFNDEF